MSIHIPTNQQFHLVVASTTVVAWKIGWPGIAAPWMFEAQMKTHSDVFATLGLPALTIRCYQGKPWLEIHLRNQAIQNSLDNFKSQGNILRLRGQACFCDHILPHAPLAFSCWNMIILEGHRTSLYRTACDYIPHWNPAIKKDGMAGRTQESWRAPLISQYNKTINHQQWQQR